MLGGESPEAAVDLLGALGVQRCPLGAAHLAERCSQRPRVTLTDAGNHGN